MKRTKTVKKRSLVASIAILCLCVAALIGGTFAWFTDTASTSVNKIQAGTLDVGLQYKNSTQTTYADVTSTTNVFKTDTLWEPGHVEYAVLKISNEGTLALKYNLGVSVSSETAGTNVNGNEFKLSGYIQYAVVTGDQSALTRDALVSAAEKDTTNAPLSTVYSSSGNIVAKGAAKEVTLVVWMPTTVGNEANYMTGTTQPTINLSIDLYATQYTNESDSFNSTYDSAAPWTGGYDDDGLANNTKSAEKTVAIDSAEQLASFAKAVNDGTSYAGYTITLNKNLDLNNLAWTPINAGNWGMTFEGNNKTISNLNATGEKNVGLFGTFTGNTMQNLTVNGATVTGINHVAALSGDGLCSHFVNCTVKNATITSNVENNDDGDKAGAITGYLSAQSSASCTGCTVEDCTITAYRDLGSVIGYAQDSGCTVSGNTVTNVVLINNRSCDYQNYGSNDASYDVGEIVGQIDGANVSNNSATGVTKKIQYTEGITQEWGTTTYAISNATGLKTFAAYVNAGHSYENCTVKLANDIDLNNVAWTPINGFKGTFNGNGKTISNLTVSGGESVGFFGVINNPAVVKNVSISNATVTGTAKVGAVVGCADSAISVNGCSVTGLVKITGQKYVGGVVGFAYINDITNCSVNASTGSYVRADDKSASDGGRSVGGIIGAFCDSNDNITSCNVTGLTVVGTYRVGGIAGQIYGGATIDGCSFNGTLKCEPSLYEGSENLAIGGIVGKNTCEGGVSYIKNCAVAGTIVGKNASVTNAYIGDTYSSGTTDISTGNTSTASITPTS